MTLKLWTLAAATALAGIATPALADKTDTVVVEQYRDKIVAARAEPGVGQYGGAELDKAMAALPALKKRLDDNKPDQVRAATTEIDALIETARNRARLAGAKQDQAAAVGAVAADRAAAQDQAAVASAQAAQASADADRARAEADKARAELAALQLKQTDAGATLVLQDVVFQTGKAELKPGAEARLRPIANYLSANPAVKVRIDGHTDAQGDDAYNMRLSQARAGSVRAALTAMGVDGARVEAVGHGEAQPVADNGNDAGRQQNRRVELTLLGQQASGMTALR